jgi:hypothetical protein
MEQAEKWNKKMEYLMEKNGKMEPAEIWSFQSKLQHLPGGYHEQADAEWIVIRLSLRSHNDTPFGRPTPCQPIGCAAVGHPQGVFGVFSNVIS